MCRAEMSWVTFQLGLGTRNQREQDTGFPNGWDVGAAKILWTSSLLSYKEREALNTAKRRASIFSLLWFLFVGFFSLQVAD